ncbi:MAG: hypothetical protein HFH87_06455 [Lachnospiraceae bacterium]|nr:hypothetical protein [Lachnospiraceae bacterium]
MKLSNTAQKKDYSEINTPLNILQIEKILSCISCYAALCGLAGCCFSLVLWHCLLALIFGNDSVIVSMDSRQVLALSVTAIISCLLHFSLRKRLGKSLGKSIPISISAEEYFRQSTITNHCRVILYLMLLTAGFAMSILLPGHIYYSDLRFLLGISAFLISFSVFCLISLLQEQHICRQINVIAVCGTDSDSGFDTCRKQRSAIIMWSVYWAIVLSGYLTVSILFRSLSMYAGYFVIAVVYFILRLTINNPFRRFSGLRAKRIPVRLLNIAVILGMAGLYLYITQNGSDYNNRYINSLNYEGFCHKSTFTYDRETGVYTISGASDEFRILQLTDIHICGSIATIRTDRRALTACYDMIRETQPDLIILTGDLVYPMPVQTFSKDNLGAVVQVCNLMNQIGIPWTMVYGNHDTETIASYSAEELEGIYHYYIQEPNHSMLYADRQPEIYGRYNQYIKVVNSDGSLNRLLFLIDSNDYVKNSEQTKEYDSIHTDQIQWYEDTIDQIAAEEGRIIPSFVFMHIPFRAFAEAQEALKRGSSDAVYLFGENEEPVSCPRYDSGFFDTIVKKQSTQAVFAGHDHLNNMAVKYKGVDLVYSKSIDYYAYPGIADKTKQRGATLITLFSDGSYQIEQVNYQK